jgi:hypothetical protein
MKKYILTENQFKKLTEVLITENTNPVEVKVPMNFKASYAVNDSNPKNFLGDFSESLIKKIKSQPNGQAMLNSGEMTVYSIKVEAGASNTWLNQTTPYDYENNYMTKAKQTDKTNELYKKNVDLANKRASTFKPFLIKELTKYGIKDNPNAQSTFSTKVINTGGVKDESRDQNLYKNPGQYIYVYIVFRYQKDVIEIEPVPVPTGSTYTDVDKSMVLTGSYYCNGKSSENREAINKNVWEKQCAQLPNDKKDNKHMSTFEIKWNENVVKDARVRPLLRWWFTWGSNDKITKVERVSGTQGKYVEGKAIPVEWSVTQIDGNNPELIHYMNINGVDIHGKYIKPYL